MSRTTHGGFSQRKSQGLALVLSMGLAVAAVPVSAAETYNLKVGGTTIGGSFYPMAAAIAQVLNKEVPQFNLTVQTTPGAGANIRLIASGEIDVGLSVTSVTYFAYQGGGKWKTKQDVRSLMNVFPNAQTFVTLQSSPIRTIADLKGKRVTAGGPGAGWESFIEPLISVYGMTMKDFGTIRYMGQSAAANALKDGAVDAAFLGGGNPNLSPTPSLASLETTHKFRPLLPPEDKLVEISRKYPFLGTIKVRGGAYKSQPEDVVWMDTGSMHLIVSPKADANMVYQLVKAIYEHRDQIAAVNRMARDIVPERVAAKRGIPYHEGAIRYFREKNLWRD